MGNRYRAKIEDPEVIAKQCLYLVEKKTFFIWGFLTYKFGTSPLDAIERAKVEEAEKNEQNRWHYGR